ncbi:MAG: Hsp70 family protein [Bryobacteraceae bacterium]|jgi:molecular chaperone DnaK (HSP70)
MSVAIGIDFGASYCRAAVKKDGLTLLRSREGEDSVPCAVGWHNHEMVVGRRALALASAEPQETVLDVRDLLGRAYSHPEIQWLKRTSPLRLLPPTDGTEDDLRVLLGDREHSPVELCACLLKKVKEDAELALDTPVESAVIAIPPSFTEKQREAMRRAAQLAGFNLRGLLDEPTAAAVAFTADNVGPEDCRSLLISNLGQATLDVALLTLGGGVFALVNMGGDSRLGGEDFPRKISEHVIQHVRGTYALDPTGNARFLEALRGEAERAVRSFSSSSRADIVLAGLLKNEQGEIVDVELELARDQFESLIEADVRRGGELVDAVMQQARFRPEDVDHVILLGEYSTIPLVRRVLAERFGEAKLVRNLDPLRSVAYGAALAAAWTGVPWQCPAGHANPGAALVCAECGEPFAQDPVYRVTFAHLGVQASGDQFDIVIPQSTPYPMPEPVWRRLPVPQPNLRRLRVPIYQGMNENASKNELQVVVWLCLPEGVPSDTPVSLALRLDRDGILDPILASLEDGSGRGIEVYPDRGGERRSRLESKLDRLRKQWEENWFRLGQETVLALEQIYNQAADAASRDLDAFERKLAEMEERFNPEPEWRSRARTLLSFCDGVLTDFGRLLDAKQAEALRKLSEELRQATAGGDPASARTHCDELREQIEELPRLARLLLALRLAVEKEDFANADRIASGLHVAVDALRGADVAQASQIFDELAEPAAFVLGGHFRMAP